MVLKSAKGKGQPWNNLSLDLFVKRKAEDPQVESEEEIDEDKDAGKFRQQQPQHPILSEVIILSSSDSEDCDRHDFKTGPIPTSSLETDQSRKYEMTPVRSKHEPMEVVEPHVSWAISPQIIDLSKTPKERARALKSHSFSSSQDATSGEFLFSASSTRNEKLPIWDPEMDLLAKFSRLSKDSETSRKLTRSESATAVLKTPTKASRAILDQASTVHLQGSHSSVNTTQTLIPKPRTIRKGSHTTSLQEPVTPRISKRKPLVRHATSPALGSWHSEKMARLLSLANNSVSALHQRSESPPSHHSETPVPVPRLNPATTLPTINTSASKAPLATSVLDDRDEDDLFALDFSDLPDSTMPSGKEASGVVISGQSLLPMTPLSLKIKRGARRPITTDHLFTPVKSESNELSLPTKPDSVLTPKSDVPQDRAIAQLRTGKPMKEASNAVHTIHSSDLEDFFDDDVFSDLMEDDLPATISSNANSRQKQSPTPDHRTVLRSPPTELMTHQIESSVKTSVPAHTTQPSIMQQDIDLDDIFGSDFEDGFNPDDNHLHTEIEKLAMPPHMLKARTNKRNVSGTTLVDSPLPTVNLPSDLKDFRTERLQRTRTSTQEAVPLTTIINNPKVHRYLVIAIATKQYIKRGYNGEGHLLDETQLTVKNHADHTMYINLRENWVDSAPLVQNVIHIIGEYEDSADGVVMVDNEKNLLIVQPDILITCTAVAEGFYCKRKIILRDRLRSGSEVNIFMVYGSIIHEIFQLCLAANEFTHDFINSKIEIMVQEFLEELYLCNVDPKTAIEYLQGKAPKICEWGNRFICTKPKSCSFVDEHRSRSRRLMSVSNIIDVEEEVWSPTYGLKGKIDVTVETCLQDAVREWKFLSPLEIKTSKNTHSIGHRAQTTLYTLLLGDRYDIDIKYGVLVYSETGDTIRIPGIASEIRDLMIARNQLALGMAERNNLPPLIEDTHKCGMCERIGACMTFHCVDNHASITPKQVEAMESPGILVEYIGHVGHVTPAQAEFFKHWNDLLTIEETDSRKYLKELWTMTSESREAAGRCFAKVGVQGPPEEVHLSEVSSKYTYVFERKQPLEDGAFKLQDSRIIGGDPIIVSDESGHVFLASGTFVAATRSTITLRVNRRLTDSLQKQIDFNEESNQAYHSLMRSTWETGNTQGPSVSTTFRIDKDEFGQAMGVARNNLVQLLLQKHKYNQMELIVDLKAPRFTTIQWPILGNHADKFNVDQVAAIQKGLNTQDYSLILGMPGTGKTTTIAALIQILVAQQKTVLLASYTHSAVDTILRKIKDCGFGILRLGRAHVVNPEVRHFCVGEGTKPTTVQQLEQTYMNPPVVATTCLGISHWLFTRRKFDYCIVDEASQVTLPTCLGPLRYAERFVLVGDHFQLSPLVSNPEAQDGGLDVSLFKRLNDAHPEAVANLEHQYRMCKDIMTVSNRLVYDGRLKCGTEEIANQSLQIPHKGVVSAWKKSMCNTSNDWLAWVLKER